MIWWGWIILGVNVVGFVIAWRWNAYGVSHEFGQPDADDLLAGLFFGGLMALLWPVCILYHLGGTSTFARVFMTPTPRVKAEMKATRARDRERELQARIRELEHEVLNA